MNIAKLYPQYNQKTYAVFKPTEPTESKLDNKTQNDITTVKKNVELFFKMLPPARKAISAYNNLAVNPLYAAGMIFRTLNELPEEINDFKDVITGNNTMREYQHPFWAFRGGLFDKKAQWLKDQDIMLYHLQPIQAFLGKIGITGYEQKGNFIKFEGHPVAKILARASLRFPLLGYLFFNFLESPNVLKAKNKQKEILKTEIKISSIMGTSALLGSIGGYRGKTAELIGLGSGIILGGKLAEKINSQI